MLTNVFCIIGESGSGKNFYLDKILSDKEFVAENNLELLVYGTTREKRSYEVDGEDYHFFTDGAFECVKSGSYGKLVECRTYRLLDRDVYYFTLNRFFEPLYSGKNIICTASPDQYMAYKKFFRYTDINVYGIKINVDLRKRIESLIKRAENDNQLYEMCRRVVNEKEEFSSCIFNGYINIDNNNFDFTESNLNIIKRFMHNIIK